MIILITIVTVILAGLTAFAVGAVILNLFEGEGDIDGEDSKEA